MCALVSKETKKTTANSLSGAQLSKATKLAAITDFIVHQITGTWSYKPQILLSTLMWVSINRNSVPTCQP